MHNTGMCNMSPDQRRFFERWRAYGGSAASLDQMIPDAPDKLVATIFAGGVWRNYWVGEAHHQRNGGVYFGDLHKTLPAEEFAAFRREHKRTAEGKIPFATQSLGCVGRAREALTHRISVPVCAPVGADLAVVSSYEWKDTVPEASARAVKAIAEQVVGRHATSEVAHVGNLSPRMQTDYVRAFSARSNAFLRRARSVFDHHMFFDRPIELLQLV